MKPEKILLKLRSAVSHYDRPSTNGYREQLFSSEVAVSDQHRSIFNKSIEALISDKDGLASHPCTVFIRRPADREVNAVVLIKFLRSPVQNLLIEEDIGFGTLSLNLRAKTATNDLDSE